MAASMKSLYSAVTVLLLINSGFCQLIPAVSHKKLDLEKCVKGMSEDCSIIIVGWVLLNTRLPPSLNCCNLLLGMGKPCHDGLVRSVIKNGILQPKKGARAALKRSDSIWELCRFEAAALETQPVGRNGTPPLPIHHHYLTPSPL